MADIVYMAKTKWQALLDSIRAKGGTSALMTADQAKAAVDAIPSGGGGMTLDWATVTEVTVGANSVTNMVAVQTYFSGYTYSVILLAGPLTVNNQFVLGTSTYANGTLNSGFRWRNGQLAPASIGSNYDAKLVEGTKYYLLNL